MNSNSISTAHGPAIVNGGMDNRVGQGITGKKVGQIYPRRRQGSLESTVAKGQAVGKINHSSGVGFVEPDPMVKAKPHQSPFSPSD